jgi:transcription initiation factor TFIIE subunit alpha
MIDYKNFVDVVKYRIHRMRQAVDEHSQVNNAPNNFVCTDCQKPFTLIEAASISFSCDHCSAMIVEDTRKLGDSSLTDEHRKRLNEQLEIIVQLLRKTEMIKLKAFHPSLIVKQLQNKAKQGSQPRPFHSSIRDVSNLEDEEIEGPDIRIQIQDDANSKVAKMQEAERKRQENALPVWHTHSTITGEQVSNFEAKKTHHTAAIDTAVVPSVDHVSNYYETLKKSEMIHGTTAEDIEETSKKRKIDDVEPEEEDPMVSVQGELVSVYEVTEEHKDKMTAAEYEAYFALVESLE